MTKPALPLTPFEKIAKRAGVKRISKDAIEEMRDVIEEIAQRVSEDAVRVSRHANRHTVMKEDIHFVTGKKA
jgi:histone H3/H4